MLKIDTITIPRWFDRHLHVRMAETLAMVLPYTLRQKPTGAVIMGNLPHPYQTSNIDTALEYKAEIEHNVALQPLKYSDFKARMTCYLTDDTRPEEVVYGFKEGIWSAVKMYLTRPDGGGGTTNAHNGVTNIEGRYKVFEAMEKHGIPLLGHFEVPDIGVDEFDREAVSFDTHLIPIRRRFTELPIVFEHVSDGRVANSICGIRNLYATVTPHHLMINRDWIFNGGLNPGYYCKPVVKTESDRLRLRKIVTSGMSNFGAGTDSAPHYELAKSKCFGCAAGIFNAPCAVELYTTVFAEEGKLENLEAFLSRNFLHIYGMEVSKEMMTLERKEKQIPQKVGTIPVFLGGKTLSWSLVP